MTKRKLATVVARVLAAVTAVSCSVDSGNEAKISRSDLGDEWPLTVESGVLRCEANAVTFEAEGVEYAVNGTAQASGDLPEIDEIWAPAPEGLGLKKPIGSLISRGLELCS